MPQHFTDPQMQRVSDALFIKRLSRTTKFQERPRKLKQRTHLIPYENKSRAEKNMFVSELLIGHRRHDAITLKNLFPFLSGLRMRSDKINRLIDGLDLVSFIIRDLKFEFFLQCHHNFHTVQTV